MAIPVDHGVANLRRAGKPVTACVNICFCAMSRWLVRILGMESLRCIADVDQLSRRTVSPLQAQYMLGLVSATSDRHDMHLLQHGHYRQSRWSVARYVLRDRTPLVEQVDDQLQERWWNWPGMSSEEQNIGQRAQRNLPESYTKATHCIIRPLQLCKNHG
jgi:hypothetical protein